LIDFSDKSIEPLIEYAKSINIEEGYAFMIYPMKLP